MKKDISLFRVSKINANVHKEMWSYLWFSDGIQSPYQEYTSLPLVSKKGSNASSKADLNICALI
jgi:hypothetical protein